MREPDKIKEVKTFHFPNATVRVHIPDITEEEREFRYKQIHDAAAELLRCKLEMEQKQKNQ